MGYQEMAGKPGLCSSQGCKPGAPGCWRGFWGTVPTGDAMFRERGSGRNKRTGVDRKGCKKGCSNVKWSRSVRLSG